ncbi:hypothetical protein AK830_g12247 [Neonectria ditissima]|uniref:Uncharacterized protein n=1 Tax=Neonectria ditissima TaxID=78410 RepID=A0A0P7B0U8_9HYPO|nr:hypothetical protein AK830_g12247 [Neonectria ditissima]
MWHFCDMWRSGAVEQPARPNVHLEFLGLHARLSAGTLGSGLDAANECQALIGTMVSSSQVHRGLCQSMIQAVVNAVRDGRVAASVLVMLPLYQLILLMVRQWSEITGADDRLLYQVMKPRLQGREAAFLTTMDMGTLEGFCQKDELSSPVRGQRSYIILFMELGAALMVEFQDRRMRWISLDRMDAEHAAIEPYLRVKVPSGQPEIAYSPSDAARLALLDL